MCTNESKKAREASDEGFAQICATANHYSALRYAVFALFAAISGALFAAVVMSDKSEIVVRLMPLVRIAGFLYTLTFWLAHIRISKLLGIYQGRAYKLGLHKPAGNAFWSEFVPLSFSACFLLVFAAWVVIAACA